jgi:hypothetical protein
MSLNVTKPKPVHLRSASGNHAVCGSGGPFSLLPLTSDPGQATCKNCLKIHRQAERINRSER